jgi:hypothetical protein
MQLIIKSPFFLTANFFITSCLRKGLGLWKQWRSRLSICLTCFSWTASCRKVTILEKVVNFAAIVYMVEVQAIVYFLTEWWLAVGNPWMVLFPVPHAAATSSGIFRIWVGPCFWTLFEHTCGYCALIHKLDCANSCLSFPSETDVNLPIQFDSQSFWQAACEQTELLILVSRPLFALIVHLQGAKVYSDTNSSEAHYGV